jgi:hypothetical protein
VDSTPNTPNRHRVTSVLSLLLMILSLPVGFFGLLIYTESLNDSGAPLAGLSAITILAGIVAMVAAALFFATGAILFVRSAKD